MTPDDRTAIVDLLAAYGVLLDRDEHEAWLALFTDDAEFEAFGRTSRGHEGLLRMATSAPGGLHLGGPPLIAVDGDRATIRQSFLFVDAVSHDLRIGWYDDEVVRSTDGWKFRRRRATFRTASGSGDRP
jgi:hypothetical protein